MELGDEIHKPLTTGAGRRLRMDAFFKGLDTETQLLVGIGAAVAAGCIPCLEKMVEMANGVDLDAKKLKAAAVIGQFVKDQPAAHMKSVADNLLGTHLQNAKTKATCPVDTPDDQKQGCGCETEKDHCACG
jgi:alkylhydroperoxidase/carboxymuconolactone decarboxylase family protein YurZ